MVEKRSDRMWVNLLVAYGVVISLSLPFYGWTPQLTVVADELSLNNTEAGLLTSVTSLFGGVALLVGGMITVRTGPKLVVLIGLAFAIVGLVVFAAADGLPLALLGRAISGIGVGFLFVAPYSLAIGWLVKRRQSGFAVGLMQSGDGTGNLFALFGFAIVLVAIGWRGGTYVQAGFLVVIFVIAALFLRNPPTDAEPGTTLRTSPFRALAAVARARNVIVAVLIYIGAWGLFTLVVAWLPTILTEDAGWSAEVAGLLSSMFAVFGIFTAVGAGIVSDRLGRRKRLILVSGLFVAAFMIVLTIAIATENYVLAAICLPLLGLGVYANAPLSLALASESVDSKHVGATTGLVMSGAFLIGGFVYPLLLGSVKDETGSFTIGFVIVSAITLVLCGLAPLFARDHDGPSPSRGVPSPEANASVAGA